jgi:hypothetical protein
MFRIIWNARHNKGIKISIKKKITLYIRACIVKNLQIKLSKFPKRRSSKKRIMTIQISATPILMENPIHKLRFPINKKFNLERIGM